MGIDAPGEATSQDFDTDNDGLGFLDEAESDAPRRNHPAVTWFVQLS